MLEPHTLTALALAGFSTVWQNGGSTLLDDALSGIIGNEAHDKLRSANAKLRESIKARIGRGQTLQENHDLAKALRRCQLAATAYVVDRYRSNSGPNPPKAFLDAVEAKLRDALADVDDIAWSSSLQDAWIGAFEEAFENFGAAAPDAQLSTAAHACTEAVWVEVTGWAGSAHAPDALRRRFLQPLPGEVSWFDAFKSCVMQRIKEDRIFEVVFTAGKLVSIEGIGLENTEILKRLMSETETVRADIADLRGWLEARFAELARGTLAPLASRPLALLVQPPSAKRDAWLRLTRPVEFIGREAELERLDQFLASDAACAWQVLYGANAVGKSRLATEWLHRIPTSGSNDVVCGFLPESGGEVSLELFDREPAALTVLIIDNATGLGDVVWRVVERALDRWSASGAKVRILLVAHSDLAPGHTSFDRAELLGEAREKRAFQALEVGVARGLGAAGVDFVSIAGLELRPLLDKEEQCALLERAAREADVTLDAVEVSDILQAASGRPALLTMAGQRPDDWRQHLKAYADGLVHRVRQGCTLEEADDYVGVLILAVLAGPVSAVTRDAVAPNAWDPQRLAAMFSLDPAAAAGEVPGFEPDVLGQEVAILGLLGLRPDNRAALCDRIAKAAPDRMLEKVSALWRRKLESPRLAAGLRERASGTLRTDAALEADILETLFVAVAKSVPRGVNLPYFTLYSSRMEAYVGALCDAAD